MNSDTLDYNKFTVRELKEFCSYRNYRRNGNKVKLIKRILRKEKKNPFIYKGIIKRGELVKNYLNTFNSNIPLTESEKVQVSLIKNEILQTMDDDSLNSVKNSVIGAVSNALFKKIIGSRGVIKFHRRNIRRGGNKRENLISVHKIDKPFGFLNNFITQYEKIIKPITCYDLNENKLLFITDTVYEYKNIIKGLVFYYNWTRGYLKFDIKWNTLKRKIKPTTETEWTF
jgi:hypothetical protein